MYKFLFVTLLASVSLHATAAPINEQWVGHWQSADRSLTISQKNVVNGGKICSWTGTPPKGEHKGCVSFYDGAITKKDMLGSLQMMRKEIQTNSQNLDASYLAEESKTVDILEKVLSQMSDDTFRIVTSLDADYEGSGDCGGFYIIDKGIVHAVDRCESAGLGSALIVTPMRKGPATGPIASLNGNWYSEKWKYGYTLKDGLGVASASNSPRFKVGDDIINLRATGKNAFEGTQVFQDGKFHPITVTLLPNGSLLFKGEKNISWTMERK